MSFSLCIINVCYVIIQQQNLRLKRLNGFIYLIKGSIDLKSIVKTGINLWMNKINILD